MAVYHLLALLHFVLLVPANSHNITAILDAFPEYSLYNSYLSQTKVCDEINSHEKVTSLVLSNSAMSSLAAKQSLPGIKNALRLLSLLKYFDPQMPHYLTSGTTVTTTLYQTSGNVLGNQGYVKITYRRGGSVYFDSARPGSAFHTTYTKSVKEVPYSLSVLEVSAPITFPGLMDAPSAPSNLTALLEKAGCKIFASLITSSGVLQTYQSTMDKGFTLFAPNDDAFKVDGAPNLSTLSRTDLVTVLQYHALPSYNPKASLKTAWGPIATMASNGSGKYNLSVISHGDDVSLNTGVGTVRIESTLLDYTPVCVIIVDSLLLPSEFLSSAPVPAASVLVNLTPIPAPSVAAPTGTDNPEGKIHRPPRPRPPRPRPPPSPRIRPPPSPRIRSPPPPYDHSPPTPPSPDTLPADAPSPDKNGAAMRLIVQPASLVIASVCTIVFLL
jgi:Fasciclin domain